jgi:hypothetical protein
MLDLVFVDLLKQEKDSLPKDPALSIMEDHIMLTFRACETGGASAVLRVSFWPVGFTDEPDGQEERIRGFDETKIRESGSRNKSTSSARRAERSDVNFESEMLLI